MTPTLTILVALDRNLIEQLIGAEVLRDAELRGRAFKDEHERRLWIAGRVGLHLEAAIR